MEYVLWLLNRSPSKALEDKKMTPYEAWHGKKANLAGIHIFGCKVNGFIPKALRDNKFSPSAKPLVFLGMSDNHKGWVLYDPPIDHISAKFHDDIMYAPIAPSTQVDATDGYTFDVMSHMMMISFLMRNILVPSMATMTTMMTLLPP